MNIHALRDADALDAGHYAAVCALAVAATFSGGSLFASSDEGASFQIIAALPAEATMGTCLTALGDFLGGNIPDELNTVRVVLANGSLSSTTNAGLLNGVNACVIADEILYFRDATQQDDGSYVLSGFLRGRRGTEYAMSTHVADERFVLVNTALVRVAAETSAIGITKQYKAVAAGGAQANVTASTFTNEGAGLIPYAPVHLGGGRDADGNLTINWTRRGRIDGGWRDLVDVPLSEAAEGYIVRIYEDDTYATVVRTIEGLTSPTTSYLAATQTTDHGSPQATVYFDVRQLSAVVGPGRAARGSV